MPSRDDEVVIVAAVRTPLTRSKKGGLASVSPAELLQTVLTAVLKKCRSPNGSSLVSGHEIDDVCVGNVLLPPAGYATLRMAAIAAGLPADSCALHTVNRQCASGLQAIATVANAIAAGEIDIGIGAGVESMSLTPMNKMTLPEGSLNWNIVKQHATAMDCLLPMGVTSDTVAKEYGLERHALDAFAAESHAKAARAQTAGKFEAEIVPVRSVTIDDGIRPTTTPAILSKLKPAFTPHGVTTAGNSSQTTDGAAAVLLMRRSEAVRRGLVVLAIWKGHAVKAVPPHLMGIGPAVAIPAVLQQTKLSVSDLDVVELNEAFASQALYCMQHLHLDPATVNPCGGAIALGHPLGATGARMICTIIQELHRRKGARYGCVSMCVGTGMGAAAILEIEPVSSL
jgi:acetyl-CoA acyltransferase 1